MSRPAASPGTASYRLCPLCARAVPSRSGERFCLNDGHALLERCPRCQQSITSPYGRFCAGCGLEFAQLAGKSPAQAPTKASGSCGNTSPTSASAARRSR